MKYSLLLLALTFFLCQSVNSQANISISTDKKTYRSGEVIKVNFKTDVPLAKTSWVGLFKASTPPGGITGYLEYFYTDAKTEVDYSFKPPVTTGDYELRLIDKDPYGKQIKSIPLKVRLIYENELSFSLITEEVKPAQKFKVKIENTIPVNSNAWVGIFNKDHPKDYAGGYKSYQYYSSNQSDVIELTAPNTTGDFELRLYASDPGALIKTIPFRIGNLDLKGIKFNPNKVNYKPEEDIVVTYTGHKDLTDRAWIGLFKADAKLKSYVGYLTYFYLNPKEKGVLTFKAPAIKGAYQIRMFYADYGPQLLDPIPFSVTSSLNKDYIKENLDTKGRIVLYGIYFDTNKSTIKTDSYTIIKEISDMLNENKNLIISIEGHTDSVGDDNYNQLLSEQRSEAVKKLLITKYNVSENQLSTKGFGESKPIGDNKTTSGRSKNRRVELRKIN